MELTGLLDVHSVVLNAVVPDRDAALQALIGQLAGAGCLRDAAAFAQDIQKREAQLSTDFGHGLAIPHAKSAACTRVGLAALTLQEPLPSAADGEGVRLLFMIAAPADAATEHLQLLSALAACLRRPGVCAALLAAATPQEFIAALAGAAEQDADDFAVALGPAPAEAAPAETAPVETVPLLAAAAPTLPYRVVAVTACPTGIAHTFLAKQALLEQAARMGISLKVEADGAAGIEDPLTPQDIAGAECILLAVDRAVKTDRFLGRPVLTTSTGEAVRHPEQLLHRALAGVATPFTGKVPPKAAKTSPPPEKATPAPPPKPEPAPARGGIRHLGHRFYVHLMSGLSRMLPFVTGSGIMIALSYLLGSAGIGAEQGLPDLLYRAGQAGFALMYTALAGFIASSIGDVPAFVPGAMGGYLAWMGMTTAPQGEWVSSGIFGALIAGFTAGALMRGLAWLGRGLPHSLDQAKITLLYPAVGLFLLAVLMVYFVNPPVGHFNNWIYACLTSLHGGSRVVLCAVLGALMAVDYGGPVNKAVILFGAMALTDGQYDIMAAIMAGGMTPPLGVALACLCYPDRFTRSGRRAAPGILLLGASFVSEGALPFALRDPLRVIPACMTGSVLAGLLCSLLGCGIPAPHGGLFLLPVATNPVGFLASVTAGSVLTTILLAVLKPSLSADAEANTIAVLVHRAPG